ncbi:MAG: hypothetical protein II942_01275 [Alphaproteobacteria bacterium]|nr:hypothetical protein [Alphaproteobacteria bacterium]
MKKILIICLILCFSCGAWAKVTRACNKSQWLNGNTCMTCPANAKCNGKVFQCKKGYAPAGTQCEKATCAKGQWIKRGKCSPCPTNADCRDGKVFVCKNGFIQFGDKCIAGHCTNNQWLKDGKCTKCPEQATCNGKTVKCTEKNFKELDGKCVCAGAAWKQGGSVKCANCPRYGVCDGKGNWRCEKGYTADINYKKSGQSMPFCVAAPAKMISATGGTKGTYLGCPQGYRWKCENQNVCGCVK